MSVRITLDFDGDTQEFERAFDSMDENFNINDTIFWLLDYGIEPGKIGGDCVHHTEHGDIKVTADTGLL